MATRIRTLNFLPEIFKTPTNSQFLNATLDQVVDQPNLNKVQGYIGSKFGYGINAKDYYVKEPSKVRTDYQLEPGVVFAKPNENTATDFISYPGITDALTSQGGITTNNSKLYESQFYSWDSFTNLDSLINYNQYYWLPSGPPAVTVAPAVIYESTNYTVTDLANSYELTADNQTGSYNPTITLLRGGTYTFEVNQNTQFWIQGQPGVTGYSPLQPNLQTRDVYGVVDNGTSQGYVTFNVPYKEAQNQYLFPGNNLTDVVSTTPYADIQGAHLSSVGSIDGVSALVGLDVMFYQTGATDLNETIYVYTITYTGSVNDPIINLVPKYSIPIDQKITARFGTEFANRSFFKDSFGTIELIPYLSAALDTLCYQDGTDPDKVGIIKLINSNATNIINVDTDILGKKQYTAGNGVVFSNGLKVQFSNNVFPTSYRGKQYYVEGVGTAIELILVTDLQVPELSATGQYIPYDTGPYDAANYDESLYIPVKPDYITIARNSIDKNAWSRGNRWFHISVIQATATYNNNPSIVTTFATQANKAKRPIIEFYPNLKLFNSGIYGKAPIDFIDNKTVDAFTEVAGQLQYYPDTAAYTNYTATINGVSGPVTGIQIASTSDFNNIITLASGTTDSFNLNDPIKFTANIGNLIAGKTYYIYNVLSSNTFQISSTINGTALVLTYDTSSTTATLYPRTTTITVANSALFGKILVGQYIQDLYSDPTITPVLPNSAYITKIDTTSTTTTLTVAWTSDVIFSTKTTASVVTADTLLDNYQLFQGARIVFAKDANNDVRSKIYTVNFTSLTPNGTPLITLTVAEDGDIQPDDVTVVFRGYNYVGDTFYYDGIKWNKAQTKTDVNQPPYFDIFDNNGISLGNKEVYTGSSFKGSTLFAYSRGTGTVDSVLGFPLQYSSINNVGDISFEVTLNSDTFNYVSASVPVTENVNIGYVYQYFDRTTYTRNLGWQTAVSPSVQYQVFETAFYTKTNSTNSFVCDVPLMDQSATNWPVIQVYVNNVYLDSSNYSYVSAGSITTVTLNSPLPDETPVQILVLSDQTSKTAYYQVPINLSNNPLNDNLTTINVGEIRGQYQSMFYNNPNTTGEVFGSNNFRDLGNLVPWGNRIIQNSASLVLPGAFLRKQNHNLFNSLQFNNDQYITYKALLMNTVNTTDYPYQFTPAEMLDDAVAQITANKSQEGSFFWSDMLPSKVGYITNTYSFANSLDVSIYPLSRIYDFTKANYYGVLVYLSRITNGVTTTTQLVINQDYVVSTEAPSLTITMGLLPNDVITIKEYNQTYGSYVPNTPTKLGLYPATIPNVFLDSNYQTPTYFIIGHDGSFTKLYGNYDPTTGMLDDYRDQVLLEFETRIYNNLKLSNVIPIQDYEILPNFFRTTDYTYSQFLDMYSESFLNWVGQNRIEYKPQFFNRNNEFTYNYRNNANKINGQALDIGYWRGIYEYFYDTSTPNLTPWEMIGYTSQPSWWTSRYGSAPYTSDNLVLWNDMAAGVNYNDGNPLVETQYVRPGLLEILPVDSAGNLVSPFVSVLGNYNQLSFQKDWIVGDDGPAEFAFRRSSSWPFTLMRLLALTKPAKFYNLAVDVDKYKYVPEFDQYLVNGRSHLTMADIDVYGSGTPVTSYINWIVDYEKQIGVDATTQITSMLDTLDVRLVYRLAGFSDKDQIRFYVEKGTPNSRNASLLIPDESYSILLYNNQPQSRIIYSGVVVQIADSGYRVYGNSQTQAYFTVSVPQPSIDVSSVEVEDLKVNVYNTYYDKTVEVPYGTIFYTVEEVSQFLASYGNYLVKQGVIFSEIEQGIEINWNQIVAEFLYWAQMGWEVGSIVNLNPAATKLIIDKENNIVQPLVLRQQNFVLNQNLMPINLTDLNILRDGTTFSVQPLNEGDTLAYGQFDMSSIEHGIVFDNTTLFNDVIYNLVTGLRQIRIYARGAKSAEWNGTLDAQGFILNQDNIAEWDPTYKYTKGSIVKYKNRYWSAITIVQASEKFDETKWQQTDYNNIQKGLLPNSSTNSYESTLYYDVNQANLKNDADLLSFSLIGYRPRDYLALADLTDITQVNVYQNLIKNKGTLNAANAFKGANLPQGGIDYDIYENWAILSGEFGGLLNNNFVDIKLNESSLPNNPSTVALTNGYNNINADMEVPLYSLYNYQRPITDPNILSTIPTDTPSNIYPDAGYVNYSDVKMASYYYANLPAAVNQYGNNVNIGELYVRDYVWLANYLQKWQVLTPVTLGSVVEARNNLNNTVTITFSEPQNLTKYQPFAIVNFNPAIDGYYLVTAVVDPYRVIINLSLNPSITLVTGLGVGFQFQSQRVNTPSSIINLPLLNTEFSKNKVWVDTSTDGSWAVYRKSLNYQYNDQIEKLNSSTFGSGVAYTDQLGYLIADSGLGEVYRYYYDANSSSYKIKQTISQNVSFGSYISYSDNTFVISETTGNVYIYELDTSVTSNQLNLVQTIASPVSTTTWGISTSISGDKNWLYISDSGNNLVYAYRLSALTGLYELVTTLSDGSIVSGDQYGACVSTDYYGDTVIIGAPKQDYAGLDNVGFAYVYNRIIQNFETTYNSVPFVPQTFVAASAPTLVTRTATNTSELGYNNYITVSTNLTGVDINDPVVFSGTLLSSGAIQANKVYYVVSKSGARFQISETRSGTAMTLATDSGSMTCSFQVDPVTVQVNSRTLLDNQYAFIGSTLNVYATLAAGDIVGLGTNNFVGSQTLDSQTTYTVGEQFGFSVDTTQYSSEIIVGAPFALDLANDANQEGSVFRYTNGGNKYGMIIGTSTCNVTTNRTILLNGYAVTLTAGNASHVAGLINQAKLTNITATSAGGLLVISLNDSSLSIPNKKLTLQVLNSATLTELGVTLYTQTQTIVCPHSELHSQFGYTVKFNQQESFVASAPVGSRYTSTTFDFIDDELDNDTVFDNNTTTFNDAFINAGAVYMFDYLANYDETLLNAGKFAYAQSVNSQDLIYGQQPYYGTVLDFNDSHVVIGTPNFEAGIANGLVTIYENLTGEKDWAVFRQSGAVANIDKIQNAQIYSLSTNNTLVNLDYIDPLQGKILGAARQNLDYISNNDPARYNNNLNTQGGEFWGADKVGQLWFDTSNVRFMNYHQQDFTYNNKWWGKVFPGSDVAVYSFISSENVPSLYQGPGTPYNIDSYSSEYVQTQSGSLTPVYFFWVRNTNIIFDKIGKTLSDSIVQSYISNPQSTGISYFTPVLPSAFSLYNCLEYINYTDSVLHIGYSTTNDDNIEHSQYTLIRSNYADDFLPGLPANSPTDEPASLYEKLLDSLSGLDRGGSVVPDPMLPRPVQSGVLSRPRQSFFYDRLAALQNLVQYANKFLALYPFNEIATESLFLYKEGPINPSTGEPFYKVSDYIEQVNWWAPGYDNNTKSSIQVPVYADLAALTVPSGTIVSVAKNGGGYQETYIRGADLLWTRIGLQYGTIQISNEIYDYQEYKLGFGDNFFDTTPYDSYPSEPTRYIIRALCEEIPPELLIYRNNILILLFEYIESETIESQNFLPWLNKTSFVDVSHTIRELKPIEVYQSDNQAFLEGYLNEVKPYHVVIKEFIFKYTGTDVYAGDITDFDLPATYDSSLEQFISPQLVYSNPSENNQFLLTDTIWNNKSYTQWVDNYGLSISGQNDFYITNLSSYLALNTAAFAVDNASGFPVNGVVQIGEEKIAYSSVDRVNNIIYGVTRGYAGTTITNHIPGEKIYTDLPAVVVLYSGRGYTEPPKVTAYIDNTIYPIPRQEAILTSVMSVDQVQSIAVSNPGSGYATLPKIIIAPAFEVAFTSDQISLLRSTIQINENVFKTGDIITYTADSGSTPIGGLDSGQHYYVNVLESSPTVSLALFSNYNDCVSNQNRVTFFSTGTGSNKLSLGAIATCVTTAAPIRENQISIKFDRTSYGSKITDWKPYGLYGSLYAGAFNYKLVGASSSIKLASTQPNINDMLASIAGASFEILNVQNESATIWGRDRSVVQTFNNASLYPNTIQITSTDGGASVEGKIGSTIGFYVGMPIKFVGATFGNIEPNTVYYVSKLVPIYNIDKATFEDTGFRIASTYDDAINGIDISLLTATAPAAGLLAYPGEITNQALLTIDYPGIRQATATTATINTVTIPINSTGFGGTQNFYVGMLIFFVGKVFGNLVENEPYYITSIIDNENFTISKKQKPLQLTVYGTLDGTDPTNPNTVITDNNAAFRVNDPIIFSDFVIAGTSVSSFGGLTAGTLYYVNSITNATHISVSTAPNSTAVSLTTVATASNTSGTITNQKDVVQLLTETGSVTAEIDLPVSPGQVTGHQFSLYPTSTYFTGLSLTGNSGYFTAKVKQTIGTPYTTALNRIVLDISDISMLNQVYNGMPVTLDQNIGNLIAGTPYYVIGYGISTVTVTSTSNVGNLLTCADTSPLYVNMPIIFSNESLGGVLVGVEYFVKSIDSATTFTISAVPGGSAFTLFPDSGSMVGSGQAWLKVSSTLNGSVFALLGATPSTTTTLTQTISNPADIGVRYILGGYEAYIINAGSGYAVDNTFVIKGDQLGGTSPENDLTCLVNSINSTGGITSLIRTGTPSEVAKEYYLKAIDNSTLAVYTNSSMTVPASGVDFPYTGVTSTTVTALTSTNITVTSTVGFNVNDPVVFTGTNTGNLVEGETYYIKSLTAPSTITVSATLGSVSHPAAAVNAGTATGLSITMAKVGDFALLPEPFYFDQSIVKYNNRVYRCIISNNDNEFIFGKWQMIDSGDTVLNAMDRVVGYYQPTINMPGKDLAQLFTGVTYPNSTYMGNPFDPDEQFEIDTILTDKPFYPTNIDFVSVVWNGATYIAPANSTDRTVNVIRNITDSANWTIDELSNQVINVNSIYFSSVTGLYIITTSNPATPLLISDNGYDWITGGKFTGYDTVDYNDTNFDVSSIKVPSDYLYSTLYHNGYYYGVGENIVRSTDAYAWNEVYPAINNRTIWFKDIQYFNVPNFNGLMVVGKIQNNINSTVNEIILTSIDGVIWTNPVPSPLNNKGFNSVTTNGTLIVVVGESGAIYSTINGSNWTNHTSAGVPDLNKVIFAHGLFVAVGNNGRIQRSSNGSSWSTSTSGTTANLYGLTYNGTQFLAVGDDNTILSSTDAITWVAVGIFEQEPTVYDVQGDPFLSGYAPEELVGGVVSDNLTMTVNTRPGTNWDAQRYQHVGYQTVSKEITPTVGQTVFSFANMISIPAQLKVFEIDGVSGLSTTIYPASGYTIDWILQTITLPSTLAASNRLRIDVYGVGNGDQLAKSNTRVNPLRIDSNSGYNEIYVNCNFSAPIYGGSGVIRPGTEPVNVYATETRSSDNTILVQDVRQFVANNPITFSGGVFGGVSEETTYYVKTISYSTNRITISDQYNALAGIAGPTFDLTTATGLMDVNIQLQNGTTWTDPIVYHNGDKLLPGHILTITRTKSLTDTVVCNTTNGLIVNQRVVFSETMFVDSGIEPFKIYYIKTIVDGNEFTISTTPNGPTYSLADATGGALCVVADYGFGIQPNGISTKIILAGKESTENPGYIIPYTSEEDYISYTLFGETVPTQYGYTVPETQYITGDGNVTFNMTNFNDGSNPLNAIVELDGLRLTYSTDYTIDGPGDSITFTSAPVGNVSITTYNLTDRQYFNTQYGITNITVSNIISVNNAITAPLATAIASACSSSTNEITVGGTTNFVEGQTVYFQGPQMGYLVPGTIYYVKSITGVNTFTISTTPDLASTFNPGTDTGTMIVVVGGQPAVRVTTGSAHNLSTNNIVRIDGTTGSVQLNNQTFYVRVINSTQFDLYSTSYSASSTAANNPVTQCSSYISGGYVWLDGSYVISDTTASQTDGTENKITVGSTSQLIVNTPIIFTQENIEFGTDILGGILAGTTYYINEISSATTLKISETIGGPVFDLSSDTATGTVNVAQWQQTNTDRLWVTVNGQRVPSSSLRINQGNYISILATIAPTDEVIITSMMPSATPNEEVYLQNVNKLGIPSVYNVTAETVTWLTQPLQSTDSVIYVQDASKLVNIIEQTTVAPAAVDGVISIGVNADKNLISKIVVYNNTKHTIVSATNYEITVDDLALTLVFTSGVSQGDSLLITVTEGNLIYVNGEQIRFGTVDLVENTLSNIQRGVNGTGATTYDEVYSKVVGILSNHRLPETYYTDTWNSYDFNPTLGDPLQISNTYPANFLNQGQT